MFVHWCMSDACPSLNTASPYFFFRASYCPLFSSFSSSFPYLSLFLLALTSCHFSNFCHHLAFLQSSFLHDIPSLWSTEKNADKIAIQSFTVPRAREWAKWATKRMSERSGARKRSEQGGASEWSNGRASGPVLTSGFLVDLVHCEMKMTRMKKMMRQMKITRMVVSVFGDWWCVRNLAAFLPWKPK